MVNWLQVLVLLVVALLLPFLKSEIGSGLAFAGAALFVGLHLLEHWDSGSDHLGSGLALATLVGWSTVWVLTNELALWLWALRLGALPVALWFVADGFANWLWDLR